MEYVGKDRLAFDAETREASPGWFSWLMDENKPGPQLDSFKIVVAEQTETHPILHAIDNDAYIKLDKLRERCPGLEPQLRTKIQQQR